MKVSITALALVVSACLFSTDFQITDQGLYLNNEPFTVKGVNYSPIPIGASFDDDDKIGDVFFDFFNPVHKVDFAKMREMGTNTIRIYSLFPWHPQKGKSLPRDHTRFFDLAYNGGDHPIYVWVSYPISNGIFRYKVVKEKPSDGWFVETSGKYFVEDNRKEPGFNWLGNQTAEMRKISDAEAFIAIAKKYAAHPAVFGWVLGNELNSPQNRANPKYWNYLNTLAGELKKIDPTKLIMVALIDDSMETLQWVNKLKVDLSNIDIWGINSYRGSVQPGLNNFGQGEGSLFVEYAKYTNKPLIITEFGVPSTTRQDIVDRGIVPCTGEDHQYLVESCPASSVVAVDSDHVAEYIEGHWKDILDHAPIVLGGIVFEWQDEYWKVSHQGKQCKHHQHQSCGVNVNFPGGCWDEAAFGIHAVNLRRKSSTDFPYPFIPDERIPRAHFETLKRLWNS